LPLAIIFRAFGAAGPISIFSALGAVGPISIFSAFTFEMKLVRSSKKHLAQWAPNTIASIINLSPAKESFFYDTNEWLVIVGGDFVAVVEGGSRDGELVVGIPDNEIGVVPNRDRAFP